MTDKELRRLRRDDLLQILINQQRQIDELNAALQRSEEALANRDMAVQEAGSLAEATLRLSGVFDAAQRAADDYTDQMRRRADQLAADAEAKAAQAQRDAEAAVREARAEAERILSRARGEAEAIMSGAREAVAPPPAAPEVPERDEGAGKRRFGFLRRNERA